jgi:hypothetical protein
MVTPYPKDRGLKDSDPWLMISITTGFAAFGSAIVQIVGRRSGARGMHISLNTES